MSGFIEVFLLLSFRTRSTSFGFSKEQASLTLVNLELTLDYNPHILTKKQKRLWVAQFGGWTDACRCAGCSLAAW